MPTMELQKHMSVESIVDVLRIGQLRSYGHVLQKDDKYWVKK